MKHLLLFIGCWGLLVSHSFGQAPPVGIATWKNNARGCYNIIHDDFGENGVIGIQNYADTMHHNRGLKFTFGAITSSCENNAGMYAKAQSMINDHGHEIINHSHSHTCAIGNEWCTTGLWAEPGTQNFAQELDHSTQSIETNTGKRPRYFIYPYDIFNEAANNHLKSIGYIGSRTGTYEAMEEDDFSPDAEGFFRSALIVDVTGGPDIQATRLNYWVDQAIANGSWVNRELHNVGNSGWGRVSVTDYRNHLNYVKQKVDAGQLWVGTISEILTYQIQKINYHPTASYDAGEGLITINWNTPSFDVATYLSNLQVSSPVTLAVNISNHQAPYTVTQNNTIIHDWFERNDTAYINVYPHRGTVYMSSSGCPGICINTQPESMEVNQGSEASFTINAISNTPITYQWYRGGILLDGENSNTLTIISAQAEDDNEYYVTMDNGSVLIQSNTVRLTVNIRVPFQGVISLPGTIEMENFDIGGQGFTYNELSGTNQGNTNYRTEPVDIEICTAGGYNIGYVQTGEWLEYSVLVTADEVYAFDFYVASNGPGNGALRLLMDGVVILANQNITPTGGWQTWNIIEAAGINLSEGNHILRFEALTGNFNIDKIVVRNSTTTSTASYQSGMGKVLIYPIPAQHSVTVETDSEEEFDVSVIDLSGQQLQSTRIRNGEQLEIESLPKGVYYLKGVADSGKVFQSKIMKQ